MKKSILILSGVFGLSIIALALLIVVYMGKENNKQVEVETTTMPSHTIAFSELPKWARELTESFDEQFLTINPYSRPGDELGEVNAIVIHYVANPKTTAAQNRSYFENLKDSKTTYASSHFIVGLDGEIVWCVPLDEISYASNSRNSDTIAIECCHMDATGKFNDATYDSVVKLTAYLCLLYKLDADTGIIRHYDITGKLCPIYFVENEDEWASFKNDVKKQMMMQ